MLSMHFDIEMSEVSMGRFHALFSPFKIDEAAS